MTVFYVTALVVVLAMSIICYFRSVYKYWKKRNVIGPKPTLFFGNFEGVALRHKHAGVLYQEIYNNFPEEKIVGIYRMTLPTLLIRDLDVAKQILIKDFEAFPYRGFDFSKEGLGDNLFHCDSTTWKALRSHISPLFTSGKLKYLVNVLKVYGDKFVDHVESVCLKNPEQEVTQLFLKYTVASIMACSFGISVDSIFENPTVFQQLDSSLFTQTYVNEMDMLFPGILNKLNLSIFNETVNRFCYEIVETVKCHKNVAVKTTNDVMDILLTLEKQGEVRAIKKCDDEPEISLKVTDHVMAGQVFVFFAAGTGNNTNVLSYAMYHLAKNPAIQHKLSMVGVLSGRAFG